VGGGSRRAAAAWHGKTDSHSLCLWVAIPAPDRACAWLLILADGLQMHMEIMRRTIQTKIQMYLIFNFVYI